MKRIKEMPVPRGTKFRVKTFKSGKRVRLAILNGKVIETKVLPKKKKRKKVKK